MRLITNSNSLVFGLWGKRSLIYQMIEREVISRYKGSVLGLLWSFISPVMLLAVYTLVFSGIFKTKWTSIGSESTAQFALILFSGMIVHGLFSETLTRAPLIVLQNVNFVKKIVFPLEILPVVSLGCALFHAAVSTFVLLVGLLLSSGSLPWTALYLPIVMLPLIILTLGLSWILASLGVYLRDIAQPIGLVMTILLFASPIFYPVSAFPISFQSWLLLNPLTFIVEQFRDVVIFGADPNFAGLFIYLMISILFLLFGYGCFQKTRRGFANVL